MIYQKVGFRHITIAINIERLASSRSFFVGREMRMTVNEAIKKLQEYEEMGYGDKPVYWLNLNIQEYVEVGDVDQLPNGEGVEVR